MNVILIPGLMSHVSYLEALKKRLEEAGHVVHWPGFEVTTLLCGELKKLFETLDEVGPAALVGHSAGGLLAVQAAQARHPNVKLVVSMGLPMAGVVKLDVPHYEARSLAGWLVPLIGPEIARFVLPHSALPLDRKVQDWVVSHVTLMGAMEKVGREGRAMFFRFEQVRKQMMRTVDRRIPCGICGSLFEPGMRWTSGFCRDCHESGRAKKAGFNPFQDSQELIDTYRRNCLRYQCFNHPIQGADPS